MRIVNLVNQPVNQVCAQFKYRGYLISSSNIMSKNNTRFEVCVYTPEDEILKDQVATVEDAIKLVDRVVDESKKIRLYHVDPEVIK